MVVMGAFSSWCATLWDKIDVDFLVEETKRLAKEIRTLNKVVRAFDVYRWEDHTFLKHHRHRPCDLSL